MSNPAVVFIHPCLPVMCSGIFGLANISKQQSFKPIIYDFSLYDPKKWTQKIKEILSINPLVVGISIQWFYQINAALKIARIIKKHRLSKYPLIIAGGYSTGAWIEDILKQDCFDILIKGDSYLPFKLLLNKLKQNNVFNITETLPNSYWLDGNQIKSSSISYSENEESLNQIDYNGIEFIEDKKYYLLKSGWNSFNYIPQNWPQLTPTFYLNPGLGCNANCIFCGGSTTSQQILRNCGKNIWRDKDKIIHDINMAEDTGFKTVHACFDPETGLKNLQWYEIIKKIDNKNIGFIWESYGLPEKKLIDQFIKKFNPFILVLSPESSNEELRQLNKTYYYSNNDLEKLTYYTKNNGGYVELYFSYFLSGDCEKTINETRKYIREVREKNWYNVIVHYFPLSPDPFCELWLNPEKYEMKHSLKNMEDYKRALKSIKWWQNNIWGWYPKNITKEKAQIISMSISLEEIISNKWPQLYNILRKRLGIEQKQDSFWFKLAEKISKNYKSITPRNLVRLIKLLIA